MKKRRTRDFKLASFQLPDLIHNVPTNTAAGMAVETEAGAWASMALHSEQEDRWKGAVG